MIYPGMLTESSVAISLPAGAAIETMRMLECAGRDQVACQAAKAGWHSFEAPMPELFYRCVQKWRGIIIDAGANTGVYSILAAAARPKIEVLAFEPEPSVRLILEKNLRMNGLCDRITVFPMALSDRSGCADLFVPSQEHGLVETSSSLERTFKDSHSKTIRVSVGTIDKHLSGIRNRFRRVGIIKIDVEGHEAAVLRGAHATISRHRPTLFVELLPRAETEYFNHFIRKNSYKDIRLKKTGAIVPEDEVLYDPDAWNHVFVPGERAFQLMRLLASY